MQDRFIDKASSATKISPAVSDNKDANSNATQQESETILKMALRAAFDALVSAQKTYSSACEGQYDDYTIWTFQNLTDAKNSFILIANVVKNHLYRQGALFPGNSEQLKTYLSKIIEDLVGHNETSGALRKILNEDVLQPTLSRIKLEREQVYAFKMGSHLSARQQKSGQPTPPIYRFFQQDLVSKIFSYVHEVPFPTGVKKPKL